MADEEGGFGGREVAGVDDEVAFVFAGFVVEDDEGVAAGCEVGMLVGCLVLFGHYGPQEVGDEPKASIASGMVLKEGLEELVPFGWWSRAIVFVEV